MNASLKSLLLLVVFSALAVPLAIVTPAAGAATRHVRRAVETSSSHKSAKRKHAPASPARPHSSNHSSARNHAAAPNASSRSRRRSRHRREVDDQADPVTINRVHTWEKARRSSGTREVSSRLVREPSRESSRELAREPAQEPAAKSTTATSDDFLKAASGLSAPQNPEAEPASQPTRTSVPAGRRASRNSSPSDAASVVSVVRPTTERPQLPPVEEVASTPEILPSLYNKRGRLVMPRPLKGSREILLHQNEVADREGLDRIQNDDDIDIMRQQGMLVALPVSSALAVDERLPSNRRYCRPWTADFLRNLSRAHYARFHTPLQVNSAVRTVEFQQRLKRTNGNAAPAEGDLASPHLTGQTIDLAKHGLSMTEIAWMRGYLLPLVQQGKVDVEEEFQQSCFHVSVYKRYLPPGSVPRREIASTHRETASALATAVQ